MKTPWPSLYEYAMAHKCPSCQAAPGVVCNAPNKAARLARVDGIRTELALSPVEHDPIARLHKTRQQAGARHYRRDVGNAPWADQREPGKRYDTLGGEAA